MMLFVQKMYSEPSLSGIEIKAIPLSRVYSIQFLSRTVTICFDLGDEVWEDCPPMRVPKIVSVVYEDEKKLLEVARDFYRACKNNHSVFCF